jgi:hypothetical protein
MNTTIITSFSLGLIFGGVVIAAVSINELNRLREMLSAKNFEEDGQSTENTEQ